jgi:hypothetical protein
LLFCLFPECSNGYFHGPPYLQNSTQTSVYKVCNLFTIFLAIFQVWHPYKRTHSTFVSKTLRLVLYGNLFVPCHGIAFLFTLHVSLSTDPLPYLPVFLAVSRPFFRRGTRYPEFSFVRVFPA